MKNPWLILMFAIVSIWQELDTVISALLCFEYFWLFFGEAKVHFRFYSNKIR
jgi:hypothetical protein